MEGVQPGKDFPVDWIGLLLAYRNGPKDRYGPELIDRLELYINAVAQGLDPVLPAIDAEDIRQQLVMETLLAADRLPLPRQPEWVPRQLMLRASREVARWLAREGTRSTVSIDETVPAGARRTVGEAPVMPAGMGISEEDLTLLHRFYVHGETGRDLAAELDIPIPTLWGRVARAAARCRAAEAARTRAGHKGRSGDAQRTPGASSFAHRDGQLRKDGATTAEIPDSRDGRRDRRVAQ